MRADVEEARRFGELRQSSAAVKYRPTCEPEIACLRNADGPRPEWRLGDIAVGLHFSRRDVIGEQDRVSDTGNGPLVAGRRDGGGHDFRWVGGRRLRQSLCADPGDRVEHKHCAGVRLEKDELSWCDHQRASVCAEGQAQRRIRQRERLPSARGQIDYRQCVARRLRLDVVAEMGN